MIQTAETTVWRLVVSLFERGQRPQTLLKPALAVSVLDQAAIAILGSSPTVQHAD